MMRTRVLFLAVASLWLMSCQQNSPTPLPVGYFRIDLPHAEYASKILDCPFAFEVSKLSRLEFYESGTTGEKCWFDIYYPGYKARVHVTYKTLNGDLKIYMEEARSMAYEHHIRASKIDQIVINHPDKDVYGLTYDLEGNVASAFQFYLTDSVSHFVRASLYFETKPNMDSLQPVMTYVKADLRHLIESFAWQ